MGHKMGCFDLYTQQAALRALKRRSVLVHVLKSKRS